MRMGAIAAIAAGLAANVALPVASSPVGTHKKGSAWGRTHGFPGAKLLRKAAKRKIGLRG